MAQGDRVVEVLNMMPPDANAAVIDTEVGESAPAEVVDVVEFDDTTQEYYDFLCHLTGYDGGGLIIKFAWSSASAGINNVVWGAAIRRFAAEDEDLDRSHGYDFTFVTDGAANTGRISIVKIGLTPGSSGSSANMDLLEDGEYFILRITRNPGDAGDDMTGDAQLWINSVIGTED